MRIECAAVCDVGRMRQVNEDAVLVMRDHELFAVIDGMGGNAAGTTASQAAIDGIRAFYEVPGARQSTFIKPLLAQAIQQANRRVVLKTKEKPEYRGMGAALAAIQIAGEFVSIAHVGDCRVYRFANSKLVRLTQDHSLVNEMIRVGQLSPEKAKDFPHKSVITRAVGIDDEIEVECASVIPDHGDVFLLCSDGLHGLLDDSEIEAVLKREIALDDRLDAAAQALIDEANSEGGRDNIAVVLVSVTWTRNKDREGI